MVTWIPALAGMTNISACKENQILAWCGRLISEGVPLAPTREEHSLSYYQKRTNTGNKNLLSCIPNLKARRHTQDCIIGLIKTLILRIQEFSSTNYSPR